MEDAEGSQAEKEWVFYLCSEGPISLEVKEPTKDRDGRARKEK